MSLYNRQLYTYKLALSDLTNEREEVDPDLKCVHTALPLIILLIPQTHNTD